ncbi:hypothetical protein [Lentzea sp. NBRC 102530]|uniref:hypothetical protein n=1 Tax=Lentzea sp. NBRC 102530 TaxID=3032201 RepID=UPI0025568E57|nr:hypothetical protein [Lentzea sp. NBRC 102530]
MHENQAQPLPGWRGGDGNAAYLDKNLRHQPMDTYLDDTVGWRFVFHLWLRGAIAGFVVGAAFWMIGLFLLVISFSGSSSSYYGSSSNSGAAGAATFFMGTGSVLSVVVFLLIVLVSRLPEPIAEWRVVLADRAEFVQSAYSQISGTMYRRQLPVGGGPRRIRTGNAPTDLDHRLYITEGDFQIYVSVFRYGTSLYLGWQMWRSRRGATLIWQFLVGIFRSMSGHNDPEIAMMRADRARAMREAVHAACREGLMVAVDGIQVPEHFGFPNGLPPVEEGRFAAAPVPGGFVSPPMVGVQETGRHGIPDPQTP